MTKPRLIKIFVVMTCVVSAGLLFLLPYEELVEQRATFGFMLALAMLTGSWSVRIAVLRMRITVSDLFVFAALVSLAPLAAPIVALASVIGAEVGSSRKKLPIRVAFNLAAIPLSVTAAAVVFRVLGGVPGNLNGMVVPLLAAAVTYPVVNLALTATAIRLETGRSWFRTMTGTGAWGTAAGVSSALLGLAMFVVVSQIGIWSLGIGIAPTIPLVSYLRSQRQQAQEEARVRSAA